METQFKKIQFLIDKLVERIGSRRVQHLCDVLLIAPVMVIAIVSVLYVGFWRVDPFIRFAHMLWVLGFWMLGTVGMFGSIISARLKLKFPTTVFLFACIAIAIAVYFTPLPRFTSLFTNLPSLILAATIGLLIGMASWLIVFRCRKLISQQ